MNRKIFKYFIFFFSFSFFLFFFLKLNQTLIVGYQETKVEWLTILCSVLVSFFWGGGVRGLPNYLTEDYKFLTKPLIDKNIVQLCSTETKK